MKGSIMEILNAMGKLTEETIHDSLHGVFIVYTLIAFASVWYAMLSEASWLFVLLAGLNFGQSLLIVHFYEKSLK